MAKKMMGRRGSGMSRGPNIPKSNTGRKMGMGMRSTKGNKRTTQVGDRYK